MTTRRSVENACHMPVCRKEFPFLTTQQKCPIKMCSVPSAITPRPRPRASGNLNLSNVRKMKNRQTILIPRAQNHLMKPTAISLFFQVKHKRSFHLNAFHLETHVCCVNQLIHLHTTKNQSTGQTRYAVCIRCPFKPVTL